MNSPICSICYDTISRALWKDCGCISELCESCFKMLLAEQDSTYHGGILKCQLCRRQDSYKFDGKRNACKVEYALVRKAIESLIPTSKKEKKDLLLECYLKIKQMGNIDYDNDIWRSEQWWSLRIARLQSKFDLEENYIVEGYLPLGPLENILPRFVDYQGFGPIESILVTSNVASIATTISPMLNPLGVPTMPPQTNSSSLSSKVTASRCLKSNKARCSAGSSDNFDTESDQHTRNFDSNITERNERSKGSKRVPLRKRKRPKKKDFYPIEDYSVIPFKEKRNIQRVKSHCFAEYVRSCEANEEGRVQKGDVIETDAVCFICKDGGELVECDCDRDDPYRHCRKCYHFDCVGLDVEDEQLWTCPRHYCDCCGSEDIYLECKFCPASLCRRTACLTSPVSKFEQCYPVVHNESVSSECVSEQRSTVCDSCVSKIQEAQRYGDLPSYAPPSWIPAQERAAESATSQCKSNKQSSIKSTEYSNNSLNTKSDEGGCEDDEKCEIGEYEVKQARGEEEGGEDEGDFFEEGECEGLEGGGCIAPGIENTTMRTGSKQGKSVGEKSHFRRSHNQRGKAGNWPRWFFVGQEGKETSATSPARSSDDPDLSLQISTKKLSSHRYAYQNTHTASDSSAFLAANKVSKGSSMREAPMMISSPVQDCSSRSENGHGDNVESNLVLGIVSLGMWSSTAQGTTAERRKARCMQCDP